MNILEQAKAARDQKHNQIGVLLNTCERESRGFSDTEESSYNRLVSEKASLTERVSQLETQERNENLAAGTRRITGGGTTAPQGGNSNYFPGEGSHSFFRDLVSAKSGDYESAQRLHQNNLETRTTNGLGAYTSAGGADFAPPGYFDIVTK